jgi:hypothetical protein
LDAPAGAVIGVPGKTERCGFNSTCVLLDSAKKACLRQACTLQGRRRGGPQGEATPHGAPSAVLAGA